MMSEESKGLEEYFGGLKIDDRYYLPKVLMMMLASYLNNYDLAKLHGCSTYFRGCADSQYW